ncbi:MAG TPA: hypothetical protein VLK56_09140 [Solirubrobacterales bacterium]|nr:hypothetical protein [Solirubrobacterales bacterium]
MRRGLLPLALVLVALGLAPSPANADEWRSEQPLAAGIGVPVGIGEVGDVEFWAPNRGMLITAGNEGIPAGLFAYDGTGWYRYSTVCGGHEGRLAWAGPDDFWTISDQQSGQETGAPPAPHISLCHFVNGAVVASYAEPLGVADSYLSMDAGACAGPDDCWFAGERLPGAVNVGAFHLHWDGASLTAIPSLTEPQPEVEDPGRTVVSLAYHQGSLYEGVRAQEGDVAPGESTSQPYLLHRIDPGSPSPFVPQLTEGPIDFGGAGARPGQLEGFRLGSGDGELWAISGASEAPAGVTALRLGPSAFEQVALSDPEHAFELGDGVTGVAAEPGGAGVWVGFRHSEDSSSSPARLTRIHDDGGVDPPILLPAAGEGIGRKGPAGPVSCPATEQCWMATEEGWLFHLGPDLPRDEDPAMHVLVGYRPPDASLPSLPPISLPEDDSGAGPERQGEALPPLLEEPLPRHRRALLTKLRQRVVDGTTLELTFVLHASAHVRLVAKRKGRVVAKTRRYTMARGRRSLRLRLDPERWPTDLDLQVHPLGKGKAK